MKEKFEPKSIRRLANIMKYCGYILIAISLIKIAFINHFAFRGIGEFADSLIMLVLGSYSVYSSQSQKVKGKINQFIEWDDKKVVFKLAGQIEPQEIEFELIENTSNSVDKIVLTTKDNLTYTLDISNFKDFEDRKKIKSKFENTKNN